MQFIEPTAEHIRQMMSWFNNELELTDWGGPEFRYPFDEHSFVQDLKLDKLSSWLLVSEQQQPMAFGQYYLRVNRCHLGRLVVNPQYRGKGIAAELMVGLCARGTKEFNVNGCSLFVYEHNKSAQQAYFKFGFDVTEYPEEMPMENCLYMTKSAG